jgi:predicted nuclease with TOPRIM domain
MSGKGKEVVEEPPPPPLKRDSFRKYLDEGGVLDAVSRAIVALYQEHEMPEDPKEYLRQFLGSSQGINVEDLRNENSDLKEEVKRLETRVQELKTQLGILE